MNLMIMLQYIILKEYSRRTALRLLIISVTIFYCCRVQKLLLPLFVVFESEE